MLLSDCNIRVKTFKDSLSSVWISFSGPCAHFPSTSNSREIGFKRIRGRSFKLPYIRRSAESLTRLKVASTLYYQQAHLFEAQLGIPLAFGDEKTHCLVLLAKHSRRADSHNYSKPIGDWLQEIGLINNDANTEIHCFWKHHYEDLPLDPAVTDIIITNFSKTHAHTSLLISSIIGL